MYNIKLAPYVCNKFKNIERLFLRRLVMNEIPEDSFSDCKNLKSLILRTDQFSNSYITNLPQNLLAGNPKLTNFEASLKDLHSVPTNFFINNPNLYSISIKESKIRTLPDNLFKPLTNLHELYLSKNNFYNIKIAWFENLENLQILYLNDNHITDIPKNAFTSLKNLAEIWLSYNRIRVIHSDSFGQHPKLEHINLMYNSINAIDEKFIDNISVKYLQFLSNSCTSDQFYDKDGDKTDLKEGLKTCFKNYQPRVEVGGRINVDESEPEPTTPAVSLFDQVDGEELLKNFMFLFNQVKQEMDKQSTTTENLNV
ncbi:hypothetical protein ACKWTF_015801 [Chironomus riparius]